MRKIEKSVRQRRIRKTKINKAVIETIALAGAIVVGTIAPNVLGAMARLGILKKSEGSRRQSIQRSVSRLVENGYVAVKDGKAYLTPRGEKFAALLREGRLVHKKPDQWDGRWRILIFDIPEKRRGLRAQVRQALDSLGFVRLQNSVWIYPYDCEDIISLFKVDRHMGKDMLYIVADSIEGDDIFRSAFGLS